MTKTQAADNAHDIIQRIGGERDFQFIVLALVDRLQEDRKLERYFAAGVFDTNNLAELQEDFLKTAFTQSDNTSDPNQVSGHIHLRYYRLMKQGFNERHFDLVVNHFVEALEDAWVTDQEVAEDAVCMLNSFRHIFETKTHRKASLASPGIAPVGVC